MHLFSQVQIDESDPARYAIRSSPLLFVIGSGAILSAAGSLLLLLRQDGVVLVIALLFFGLVLLNIATAKAYDFQIDTREGVIDLRSHLAIHKSLRASQRRIPVADIAGVDIKSSAGGRRPSGPFSLELLDHDSKRIQVTADVFGVEESKLIATRIRQLLGIVQ